MKNQKSVLLQIPLILFLLTLGWGCTRNNANKTQISLDLGGLYRGKASAQSLTERVVKVAINVHGGPQLATAGWESCHCLPDDQVELPPNIFTLPVSEGTGRLIQVLIVTETMTGKTYFSYGDKLTNIVKGDNIVEISVNTSMQSENSAEAGIRYIRSDGSGPSGVIDLLYRPSSDKPSMLVHSMSAVGGWMRIHLFETTKVDYRLRETGEVLFAGVNFSHSDFLPSSRMLHVRNPIFFADKNHTGSPPYEAMPASELFFGFAGPGALGKVACYEAGDNLPLQKAWKLSDGSVTLNWSGTTPTLADFRRIAGGVDKTLGACTSKTDYVDKLTFHHEALEGDWVAPLLGFEGGFQLLKGQHGPSVSSSFYQTHIQASQVTWQYLPGTIVGPNSIAGIRVFKRLNSGTAGNDFHVGGDSFDCNVLPGLGFLEVANVSSATAHSVLLRGLSPNDIHNTQAILCPYDASGRFLAGLVAQAHDLGGGLPEFGSGHDGDRTISSNIAIPSTDLTVLGSKYLMAKRDISAISLDGRTLQLASPVINSTNIDFEVGDEIIWMVLAAGSMTACGPELVPGRYGFNIIEGLNAGTNSIVLKAPMVLDGGAIAPASLQSSSTANGSSFCRIFVQRVPHFNNLTLDSTAAAVVFYSDSLANNLMGGGGLLAFRVLNSMSFVGNYNFILSSSTNGFAGGTYSGTSYTGVGHLGDQSNHQQDIANAGGGSDDNGGGGGAGASPGGNGGGPGGSGMGSGGGQSLMSLLCGGNCDPFSFVFYGGGGGSGSPAGTMGGRGGGAILISAYKIENQSGTGTRYIKADGGTGNDVASTGEDSAGGGGGGTILIKTKDLATNLTLSAMGGNGGSATSTAEQGGGGGGGGYVHASACSGTGSFGSVAVSGGTAGSGSSGYSGDNGAPGSNFANINANAGPHCYP